MGTIFSVNLDGTGFQVLKNATSDLGNFYNGLITDGTSLYGYLGSTSSDGGPGNSASSIPFKIAGNGSGFQTLGNPIGAYDPLGTSPATLNLCLSGSNLYVNYVGSPIRLDASIYCINTDGTNTKTIYQDSGVMSGFVGRLTIQGSKIYGMSSNSVFSMNTDGTGLQILHTFTVGSDGQYAENGLTLVGSTLYGATEYGGGSADDGTIFSINTDGSDYQILHSFSGEIDGNLSDLTVVDSTLYATSTGGGYKPGILFSMPIPEPSTLTLLGVGILEFFA
jgi:uncharacterized repeat protein (TIGR03803 family)